MIQYITNTQDLIDWNQVIEMCKQQFHNADKNTVTSVVDRSEADAVDNIKLLNHYRNVIGTWKNAGYNLNEIVWYDYYPGIHFPIEVQEIFSKIINVEPLRVFVSEVLPGTTVPYHWDVEDNEEEWLEKYGDLERYVCCIDQPRIGSFLVFEHSFLYQNKQGDIYKWQHYKDFHGTSNVGEYSSYYFHFLGYKK